MTLKDDISTLLDLVLHQYAQTIYAECSNLHLLFHFGANVPIWVHYSQ